MISSNSGHFKSLKNPVLHFIVVCFVFCPWFGLSYASNPMLCEKYNHTTCPNDKHECNGTEECKPTESDKSNLCYVLWQNTSKTFTIKLKGCWIGSHDACSVKNRCMSTKREPNVQLLFCCCEGSMCNQKMSVPTDVFSPTPAATKASTSTPVKFISSSQQVHNILLIMLPFVAFAILIIAAYFVYRRRKMARFNQIPSTDPSPLPHTPPFLGFRPIQLIEIKAQGRFGQVWKALVKDQPVAVKIFPLQDKCSWLVEQDIYQLPQISHENILQYIGAERHQCGTQGDHIHVEYWLITAYHDKGSLCDYLKANLVSWGDVLKIADSITKGLMHLHEEIPAQKGEKYKPAVAHRDFKSKNVLIKEDMNACIADFGLALVFHQGIPAGEAHSQVGTRRYMAPEVLEGAINFNRDAFLRIDMYACGIVLWELLSRCSAQEGPVDQYMLPFEDIVGQHPTLEDMQEMVSQKKVRPKFKDNWRKHPGMNVLCDTIEECWDQDAEARLSASCIQERLNFLYKTQPPFPEVQMSILKGVMSCATSNTYFDALSPKTPIIPRESSL